MSTTLRTVGRSAFVEADLGEQLTAWHETRDAVAREAIVLQYLPLCSVVAHALARRMPEHVDREELTSLATLGLFRAVDRYDPSLGNFRKYAVVCMRSTVLDGTRAEDWAPRSLRKRQRALESTETELRRDYGREPTVAEISLRLGATPEQVRSLRMEVSASWMTHLDDDEASTTSVEDVEEVEEFRTAVVAVLRELPQLCQLVVALRYYEQMSLAEIALALGRSKDIVTLAHNTAVGEVWDRVRELAAV